MSSDPKACGACAGTQVDTPAPKFNPPGQPTLRYRVGAQAEFMASLLARLSGSDFPALAGLSARTTDDPAIALCDAAATMADVLTFYQERIVNESYLGTATERRSLLELANLVGYAPAPGVAADTHLAFETEKPLSPASPPVLPVKLDIGTRVQSVPGQDEKPQTFETLEVITARPEWNALLPQLAETQTLFLGQKDLYLAGTATQLAVGDAIVLVGKERRNNPKSNRWDMRILTAVELQPEADRTRVVFTHPLGSTWPAMPPASDEVKVFALRQRASLFGANAPQAGTLNLHLNLDDLLAPLAQQVVGLSTPAAVADKINALAAAARSPLLTATGDWAGFVVAATEPRIDLDSAYPKVVTGSWLVLSDAASGYVELYSVTSAVTLSLAKFGISGRVTRLGLHGENLDKYRDRLRETQVYAQSEKLELSRRPLFDAVQGSLIVLETQDENLRPGQALAVAGRNLQNQERAEIAHIDEASDAISHDGARTTLRLDAPLKHVYARASLRINANVARATQGETVSEIAGSGRAALPDQRFTLRQFPLTYVSSARPEGCESTAEVRVNDLLWREVPTLFEQPASAHVYRLVRDDEGRSSVQFGDGVEGARLPTGQDNVRLRYRKGLGSAGNVRAGTLTTLLSRPLGLKAAVNPVAAAGGTDAEGPDTIRRNAPISVLTLGRAVSVRDYADFARSFAGIAKAHALWVPYGPSHGMHLTVAGDQGAEIAADGRKMRDLVAALRAAGDPLIALTVQSYRVATFWLKARLKRAPDALAEKVFDAVRAALRARFAFAPRDFGQPVSLSEVIACMQACAGVVAVDVDVFRRSDQPLTAQPVSLLPAFLPRPDANGAVQAAELLCLDEDRLELVEMP